MIRLLGHGWGARAMEGAGRHGAMEHTSDGVGSIEDLDDTHANAALAAGGDIDGEHAGEEAGPAAGRKRGVRGSGGATGCWRRTTRPYALSPAPRANIIRSTNDDICPEAMAFLVGLFSSY